MINLGLVDYFVWKWHFQQEHKGKEVTKNIHYSTAHP